VPVWSQERQYAAEYFCSVRVRHDDEATLEESMTETSSVLGEGRQMPSFELSDEEGRPRKLLEYLEEGPVILVFYRGDW
jgi:hypothetical protein